MHYKDLQNNIHSIDSAEFENMLPTGSVPITEQEAEAMRPKPVPPTPLQQIRAIESKPEVADAFIRATRQLFLKTGFDRAKAKPAAAGLTNEQIETACRSGDADYKILAEAEDTIKPLRDKK